MILINWFGKKLDWKISSMFSEAQFHSCQDEKKSVLKSLDSTY